MFSEATFVNSSLRMTRSDLGTSWDAYMYYKSMVGLVIVARPPILACVDGHRGEWAGGSLGG